MKRSVFIPVIAVILLGCGGPPDFEVPGMDLDVPSEWTGGEVVAGPPEREWWNDIGNTELDTIIREALDHNYDLRFAAASVEAAAAAARISGADLYPQINLAGSGSRAKNNIIGFPIPGAPGGGPITIRSNRFAASLEAQWEIDLWGRISAGKSAAAADFQATQADLAAARLSIAAETARAWFGLIEARLQVQLAQETADTYRRSLDRMRRRYEQGVRPSLDYRLSITSLAEAETLLEERRQRLDLSARRLQILLGRYPSAEIDAPGALPVVTDPVPGELPTDLLVRRPDLIAAERRIAASGKRVSESKRALLPRITLTGTAGTLSEQVGEILNGNFSVWSIAAGFLQPIFQGGRLRANVSLREAFADQAFAAYAGSVLRAFAEVESALFFEESLARGEEWVSLAAEQSDAAWHLAERQYDAGLTDYITVLETRRRALVSNSTLIAVRRARLDARVNLHVALGGGFDMNENWASFLEGPIEPQ